MKHVEFGMDLEIKRDIQGEATKGHNVTHVLYTGEQSDSIFESNDRSIMIPAVSKYISNELIYRRMENRN